MGQHRSIVEIAAPPAAVYAIYTDSARFADWQEGVRAVTASGPLASPGTRWSARYEGPFKIEGLVLAAERDVRHQQRFTEMLGLVRCTTTAQFQATGAGTRLVVDLDYAMAGGPLGRLFDGMIGREIAARFAKDLARLKTIAERDAGG